MNKLIKDKYIAMYFGLTATGLCNYKKRDIYYKRRYKALKEIYKSYINSLDPIQLQHYSQNLKDFENK